MKNIRNLCILFIISSILLVGCSNGENTDIKKGENTDIKKEENTDIKKEFNLKNTYSTRYGEANAITYPSFSFDYPSGWKITNEEITPTSEKVVLSNENGIEVTYWYFGDMKELTGTTRLYKNSWGLDTL